jgi:hypothetical protein
LLTAEQEAATRLAAAAAQIRARLRTAPVAHLTRRRWWWPARAPGCTWPARRR